MQVSFIKTSHQEYTLECMREDGSVTSVTLETKSYLKHDIVHFVLETTAHLQHSFYAIVQAGRALDTLTPKAMRREGKNMEGEIAVTELIVGALQGMLRNDTSPAEALPRISAYIKTQGNAVPEYLSESFIANVLHDVRLELRRYDELKTGERLIRQFSI